MSDNTIEHNRAGYRCAMGFSLLATTAWLGSCFLFGAYATSVAQAGIFVGSHFLFLFVIRFRDAMDHYWNLIKKQEQEQRTAQENKQQSIDVKVETVF